MKSSKTWAVTINFTSLASVMFKFKPSDIVNYIRNTEGIKLKTSEDKVVTYLLPMALERAPQYIGDILNIRIKELEGE